MWLRVLFLKVPLAPSNAPQLCPRNPAWLDVVNILVNQPTLVINPYRNHLARTYDGLPQRDPLSTLIFSLTMIVIHKAIKQTTSEVRAHSYIHDTVLVGPADDLANVLQELPRALQHKGMSLQPQKSSTMGSPR